ncbi:hypothetical protein UlMin_009700 [Ulmus minor]
MGQLRTIVLWIICLFLFKFGVEGRGLSYNFYEKSCPQVENIIRVGLRPIFSTDFTSPAAFLRLMFHDCQVQGCDASILVDQAQENFTSEMDSARNFGIRKRETIGILKSMVESECPQQVSCADILILAAREAVAIAGGPHIEVPLGRRDSSAAPSFELADTLIPPATIGVSDMLQIFANKGMSTEESVAIIGAHTLGITHCVNILDRLYEGKDGQHVKGMEAGFEVFLRLNCPHTSLTSNITFVFNDPTTLAFDNLHYRNIIDGLGVLRIDAEMAMDPRTSQTVRHFAADRDAFFRAFSSAFVKLSTSGALVRNQGGIRKKCNIVE